MLMNAAGIRHALLCGVVLLPLSGVSPAAPAAGASAPPPATFSELRERLLERKPDLEQFRKSGPFDVAVKKNHELRLSGTERVKADVYLTSLAGKVPLVILMHGHDSSKEAHARQAMQLASWGMHSVAVQLAKEGPWDGNGRMLARIVGLLQRSPQAVDSRIDAGKILLAGHSFGAYAVTVAIAGGAAVAGGILLDPALVGNAVPAFMQKISRPVVVLGADEAVSPVRYREYFFHYTGGHAAEVSVKGAGHEDAQYPTEFSLHNKGVDPDATEELQITFVSLLTASAFSLSATGAFDYAWASFGGALDKGALFGPKRK